MASRLALSLLAVSLAAALGCAPASPPAPGNDEALFVAARSCDPKDPDCVRLRTEAIGLATRAEATRGPKPTYTFAPR